MILKRLFFLALALCLVTQANLFAQSGKISGEVTDAETGEGLPFANVVIVGTDMGAATNVNGKYTILNVPPGVYDIRASVVGYQPKLVEETRVNVDFTTRINMELQPGSIEMEAVVVRGERNPLVREDLTNPTVAITSETIDELPVDQISDVIRLQAGVVVGDDGNIHIRGGYSNEISYTLNGISLNDPYGNRRSVGLATNAVQEVSVSSGTFNAEYGNALSGVVNYVTKEGGNDLSFSVRSYMGDYLTGRTDLYDNIEEIDPLNRGRVEGTLGGPIPGTGKNVKFFLSGVYEDFGGLYYYKRLYKPTDSYIRRSNFRQDDPRYGSSSEPYYFNPFSENSDGTPTGDGELVPANPSTNWNLQGNISWKISNAFKLKYETVYNQGESMGFSRTYKFNPDGDGKSYSNGIVNTLELTHTVSENMFYKLKASHGYNRAQYYLYEDVTNPGYLPDNYSETIGNTFYYAGGTSNYRLDRSTTTTTIKGDLMAQYGNHEVKAGFEGRLHHLDVEEFNVQVRKLNDDGTLGNITDRDLLYDSTMTITRYKPDPNEEPSLISQYDKYPVDGALYIQDKIELAKTLILNVGLRAEYFDPKSQYNPQFSKDLTDLGQGFIDRNAEDSEPKIHLSPRISVSYPITDRGIIRFSYGHFYQNGSLSRLYDNHNFYVDNFGTQPQFGNPNVNMQRSVQYEMGLQQGLTDDFKFDLTGFYKDVRDYIFFQTVYTETGRQYDVLTNLAYSNVRGITLSFLKRRARNSLFYATLDYTFQIAEGNRTYPEEDLFFSEQSNEMSEMYLVPLQFDRSHVITSTLGLNKPNNWSLGLIGNIQTGTPYTPQLPSQYEGVLTYEQNSDRKPLQWNVDLKFEKFFEIGPLKYSLFVQVYNLFDTENQQSVYVSTGESLRSIDPAVFPYQFSDVRQRIQRGDPGMFSEEIIDNYYSKRPERVSNPREIRLGFSILFN